MVHTPGGMMLHAERKVATYMSRIPHRLLLNILQNRSNQAKGGPGVGQTSLTRGCYSGHHFDKKRNRTLHHLWGTGQTRAKAGE